jgi:hypothetical protein
LPKDSVSLPFTICLPFSTPKKVFLWQQDLFIDLKDSGHHPFWKKIEVSLCQTFIDHKTYDTLYFILSNFFICYCDL